MLDRITWVLEILSIICCVHCIYRKKIKFDINAVVLVISILTVLECIKYFQWSSLFSLINFVFIYVYCKRIFKKSWKKTFLNMILHIIVLTTVEFISALLVGIFITENIGIRNVWIALLVLIICRWILPGWFPDGISMELLKGKKNVKRLLGFVILAILFLLIQSKFASKINVVLFTLVVPTIFLIVWLLSKWNSLQISVDNMKKEIQVRETMKDNYDDLLENVRMRQHEFKNHLAAILATHYTYKTYEKLVQAQDEYCNKIKQENRHNNLLNIGDKVLTGFLYGKIQEIEAEEIDIEYEICARVENYEMPIYHLIEILGVLFDNAAESVKERTDDRVIKFEIKEEDKKFLFIVSNRTAYITYDEIEKLFEKGISSKGSERGLGLYYVKLLCQEWNSDICCQCLDIEQKNWIEFGVRICKADSH